MRRANLWVALAAFVAIPLAAAAQQTQQPAGSGSKDAFLERWKEEATVVAPGVWLVEPAPGVQMRASFGREGLESEIARLQDRLGDLELRQALQVADPTLSRRIERTQKWLVALEDLRLDGASKTVIEGGLCNAVLPQGYLMEGALKTGSSGTYAFAFSEVGIGLDFGPPPGRYPDRYAGADVYTRTGRRFCGFASDSDVANHGGLGYATAQTQLPCSSCAWVTESYALIDDCVDNFQALYVSSGTIGICY